MALHQYHCNKCKNDFELNIGLIDGRYVLNVPPTEEEEKALWDEGKDPRDFWIELPLKDIPESPPCSFCGSKKTFKPIQDFGGYVKGNCFTNRERERKFYEKGLDKQQANRFYDESLKASKERISSGGTHYKKVDFDMQFFAKKGLAKKTQNVTEKLDKLKKFNAELVKVSDSKKKK